MWTHLGNVTITEPRKKSYFLSNGLNIFGQVKVHLAPQDSRHDELDVEDGDLGLHDVGDEVEVILARDDDVLGVGESRGGEGGGFLAGLRLGGHDLRDGPSSSTLNDTAGGFDDLLDVATAGVDVWGQVEDFALKEVVDSLNEIIC